MSVLVFKKQNKKHTQTQKNPTHSFTHTNQSKSSHFSTLRSLFRPIIAVGVKANDRKWERGNQNQNWVKTSRPTIDGM